MVDLIIKTILRHYEKKLLSLGCNIVTHFIKQVNNMHYNEKSSQKKNTNL